MSTQPILMRPENIDRRVLGAFVCVDAVTGSALANPIPASAPRWRLRQNRNGVYVIFDGPGMRPFTTQFTPDITWPATPTPFEVTLRDPNRRYLPRRANVGAPMKVPVIPPAPAGSATNPSVIAALNDPSAIFNPQRVPLYPSPSAPIAPNWAVIHASVVRSVIAPPQGLPWAVLQVVRDSDKAVLATGLSDASGEALLAVIGLSRKVNTSGVGPVTLTTVAVTITAFFDPAVLTQPSSWIPNPDDILTNLANPALKSASQPVQLESGQELSMSFAISF
jgi:hypothetical protein